MNRILIRLCWGCFWAKWHPLPPSLAEPSYENIIGRSAGFWEYLFQECSSLPLTGCGRAGDALSVGQSVRPTLIRNNADELTYILHILIRYEVEKDLIRGTLSVAELPQVWRQKYTDYLGITPRNDREGVLQDIQWAAGYMGYFPPGLPYLQFDGRTICRRTGAGAGAPSPFVGCRALPGDPSVAGNADPPLRSDLSAGRAGETGHRGTPPLHLLHQLSSGEVY